MYLSNKITIKSNGWNQMKKPALPHFKSLNHHLTEPQQREPQKYQLFCYCKPLYTQRIFVNLQSRTFLEYISGSKIPERERGEGGRGINIVNLIVRHCDIQSQNYTKKVADNCQYTQI